MIEEKNRTRGDALYNIIYMMLGCDFLGKIIWDSEKVAMTFIHQSTKHVRKKLGNKRKTKSIDVSTCY